MIKVGIIGANGYLGIELIRILSMHPNVKLSKIFQRELPIDEEFPHLQSLNLNDRWDDKVFLVLFIVSNLVLFGGVYWSKFAHMFYKPGAAIQKNLAEADGSRDNLPPEADAPKQFGLGISRENPKHYYYDFYRNKINYVYFCIHDSL